MLKAKKSLYDKHAEQFAQRGVKGKSIVAKIKSKLKVKK